MEMKIEILNPNTGAKHSGHKTFEPLKNKNDGTDLMSGNSYRK
jgi:hypothetical protein